MTDMNERIAALREAVGKMTPGEWHVEKMYIRDSRHGIDYVAAMQGSNRPNWLPDAAGIVALRNNAIAIIDEQAAEIARLRANEELLLKIAKGMGELGVAVRDLRLQELREQMMPTCFVCGGHHGNLPCPYTAVVATETSPVAVDAGPTPLNSENP